MTYRVGGTANPEAGTEREPVLSAGTTAPAARTTAAQTTPPPAPGDACGAERPPRPTGTRSARPAARRPRPARAAHATMSHPFRPPLRSRNPRNSRRSRSPEARPAAAVVQILQHRTQLPQSPGALAPDVARGAPEQVGDLLHAHVRPVPHHHHVPRLGRQRGQRVEHHHPHLAGRRLGRGLGQPAGEHLPAAPPSPVGQVGVHQRPARVRVPRVLPPDPPAGHEPSGQRRLSQVLSGVPVPRTGGTRSAAAAAPLRPRTR